MVNPKIIKRCGYYSIIAPLYTDITCCARPTVSYCVPHVSRWSINRYMMSECPTSQHSQPNVFTLDSMVLHRASAGPFTGRACCSTLHRSSHPLQGALVSWFCKLDFDFLILQGVGGGGWGGGGWGINFKKHNGQSPKNTPWEFFFISFRHSIYENVLSTYHSLLLKF